MNGEKGNQSNLSSPQNLETSVQGVDRSGYAVIGDSETASRSNIAFGTSAALGEYVRHRKQSVIAEEEPMLEEPTDTEAADGDYDGEGDAEILFHRKALPNDDVPEGEWAEDDEWAGTAEENGVYTEEELHRIAREIGLEHLLS